MIFLFLISSKCWKSLTFNLNLENKNLTSKQASFIFYLVLICSASTAGSSPNLFCYYTMWSSLRADNQSQFRAADHIDPNLCTHLVYAFARVSHDSPKSSPILISPFESALELGADGFYSQVTRLKSANPDLKVLLSVTQLLKDPTAIQALNSVQKRAQLIDQTIQFIKEHKFDGIGKKIFFRLVRFIT